MKKQISFCISILLMLLVFSCATEELRDETSPENLNGSNRSANKSAGDGLYDVLGHGYNAAGEYANATAAGFKIIDIDRFKVEQSGRLITENTNSQEYVEEYGENAETYSKMVSTKIDVTAGIPLFGKTLSVGFNSALTTNNKFDGKYIYGSYNLLIKQRRFRLNATNDLLADYLTPEFIQDLQTKTPQQIVQDYGTHIAVDIYTGAKMDVLFQSETSNQNREKAARIGVKVGMKSIFDVNVNNDVNTSETNQNYSRKLSYRTRGGNPSIGLVGEINLDQTNPKINFAAWQNSSTINNAVLIDFSNNGLILLYNVVKDAAKKAQLKAYIDQYLIDNKVFMDYKTVPIYRYYNSYGDHYYNQSSSAPSGYHHEGIEFYAFSFKVPTSVPIYVYYNPGSGDHYYAHALSTPGGYVYEGIAFYAHANNVAGSVPIYKYYNSYGDHFYSKSPSTPGGYHSEGIAFYAY
nr:MAC/perforin domain-containing protein [uncultured Chryseobacterium sp.]